VQTNSPFEAREEITGCGGAAEKIRGASEISRVTIHACQSFRRGALDRAILRHSILGNDPPSIRQLSVKAPELRRSGLFNGKIRFLILPFFHEEFSERIRGILSFVEGAGAAAIFVVRGF
jgi:hypothetical protein